MQHTKPFCLPKRKKKKKKGGSQNSSLKLNVEELFLLPHQVIALTSCLFPFRLFNTNKFNTKNGLVGKFIRHICHSNEADNQSDNLRKV